MKLTIQDQLDKMKRINGNKFTKYKFIHRNVTQTKKRYGEVFFYFVLEDINDGSHTLMEWYVRRKDHKTPSNWSVWLKQGHKSGKPGIDIYAENVVPNLHDEYSWRLHRYIGFSVKRALSNAP